MSSIKTLIDAYIKRNANQEITGPVLNGVLTAIADALGTPFIGEDGYWYTYDPETGQFVQTDTPAQGESGVVAAYAAVGVSPDPQPLPSVNVIYDATLRQLDFTFYDIQGPKGDQGTPGITGASVSVDANVGTPSVDASIVNSILTLAFHNLRGAAAGFGTPTISVGANQGTPSASVTASGPDTAKVFNFAFDGLKGETGPQGPQGPQGNPGSSQDYPFTMANNLTTDDPTVALTAAMGVQLEGEVSQLSQEVDNNADNIVNLQQEIDAIQPIVIEGNVTNAPDQEDITTDSNNLLKFANRPTAVNQMGYKILRKGATFASQVTDTNTIYEIRYPFDLGGNNVTIPSGCVLKFNGGKLSNGTLSGTFEVDSVSVCFDNILFGSASIERISLLWFDIRENTPCTDLLTNIFRVTSKEVNFPTYDFPLLVEVPSSPGIYGGYPCVQITTGNKVIDFRNNVIKLVSSSSERYQILAIYGSNTVVKNLRVVGDVSSHTGATGEWGHGLSLSLCHDVTVEHCEFSECWGDGINLVDLNISGIGYQPYNIKIKDTKCLKNRRQGISIEAGENIVISNCELAYTGAESFTQPGSGIDIEPWHDVAEANVDGVIVSNCFIHDNTGQQEILISGSASYLNATISNISIENCTIKNDTSAFKLLVNISNVSNISLNSCEIGSGVRNGLVMINNAASSKIVNTHINGQIYAASSGVLINATEVFRNTSEVVTGYESVKKAVEFWSCSSVTIQDSKFFSLVYGCFYFNDSLITCVGCTFKDCLSLTDTGERIIVNMSVVDMDACYLSLGAEINFIASASDTHHFSIKNSKWEKKNIGRDYLFIVSLMSHISSYDYDIEIRDTELINRKGYVYTRGAASDSVKIYIERFPEISDIPSYNDYRLLPVSDANGDYPIKTSGDSTMRGYVKNHLTNRMIGFVFFDTTLGKPVWWDGSAWKDATGTTV